MKCIAIKLPEWNLKGIIKKLISMVNNYTLKIEDIPVKKAHKFDKNKLSNFLIGKLDNFSGISRVGQFNAGQSNPTFVIESLEQHRYVLRKKPPGKLLPSAHAVDREYTVQKALYNTDVPVAKMHLYCDDINILGTEFYVMEYLEGRVFEDTTLPGHSSKDRTLIYNSMNETMADLHKVIPKDVGLENFGRPGSYFNRQLKRWSQQWELSKQQDIPEMPLLIDWISKNIPDTDETTIVHGDYRLGNLIYDLNEPKVIAVLDWELSTLGHPLADLGYNLMLHEEDANVREGFSLKNLDLEKLGIPSKDYLVRKYCEMVNRDIINPNFYIVFSMFRNVAILEGVLARGRAGNASSSLAEEKGALAKPIAKIAWNLVQNSDLA